MDSFTVQIIIAVAGAVVGWLARHFNIVAPKVKPDDVPALPTGLGHGQLATFLVKLAVKLAEELAAANAPPKG